MICFSEVRENFMGEHATFCDGVRDEMTKLNDATSDLFLYCCNCCVDGHIDAKEKRELQEKLDTVKRSERSLEAAYRETMKSQPYVSEVLNTDIDSN